MAFIFSADLKVCKNILETLNLPNEQLVQLDIRSTNTSEHVMVLLHKDIPWGPTHAMPNMFVHSEITTIKWCPLAPEPKYVLCGNPQAVYLMIRRRLLTQLQHVINRMLQQLDFLFIPAADIPRTITTPLLAGFQAASTQLRDALTPGTSALVVPPTVDQSSDAENDTGISNSPVSSELSSMSRTSTLPEAPSPARELVTTETQTDDQVTQLNLMADSPWAWLDN
jgi:hypothetical protein